MEWVESIGDSIELAKEHALDRLGVHEDDAEFDVLSDVKTGVFGRVKEPARVRARVRPKTPRAKESRGRRDRGNRRGRQGQGNRNGNNRGNQDSGRRQQDRSENGKAKKAKTDNQPSHSQQADQKQQTPQKPKKKAETVNQDQEMMPLPQQADIAEDFVRGLAERFGTTVDFHRENIGSDEIRITVSGDQLGRMVGHRGMTAGAIDDLVRTVLQRRAGSARNGRVRVDIGGVIARRNEALVRFAREQALEVQDSGVPRSLEPMNAADRKIVHDAVDGTTGVQTISEGDDPRRYVVIVPSE
ncbi:MAG: hypothetical protein F4Y27_00265 [Acidimicrobiaceae bacterium]|nr:Jag N-terminal domain-containing protein [Acidimicrobiaceae bacterium]MXW62262.1 hypothetical protein [Acidimicrobiaceae bacterium]MXW77241.1 hypothetical protein [Acidimicrobiaceae bacterium]MYA73104.1 hypothetical protein [Acidimicrobiaceae bacterium]MYC42119.1 hypothetical protein [Acidimicrobiaceae bacterium]